jgi:hypothetical protein
MLLIFIIINSFNLYHDIIMIRLQKLLVGFFMVLYENSYVSVYITFQLRITLERSGLVYQ